VGDGGMTRLVAVGQSGDGMWSDDGITWSSVNIGSSWSSSSARAVTWFPHLQQFWGAGFFGEMGSSPDGAFWTDEDVGDAGWTAAGTVNRLIYAEDLGLYFAGGEAGKVISSPDLVTWTVRDTGLYIRALTWVSELGLLLVGSAPGVDQNVRTSPDGVTFTSRTTGLVAGQLVNNSLWVSDLDRLFLTALDGGFAYSSNGTSWTAQTLSHFGTDDIWGMAYSPNLGRLLVFASSTTKAAYSDDGGATFTAVTLPASFGGVFWGAQWVSVLGMFVIVSGTTGKVATSPDGITWTQRTSAVSVGMNDLAFSFTTGGWCVGSIRF
jgi:hypothetical protein